MPYPNSPTDPETPDRDITVRAPRPVSPSLSTGNTAGPQEASSPGNDASCDSCDTTFPADEGIETLGGSTICPPCRDDGYRQCDVCDGWRRSDRLCPAGCDSDDDDDDDGLVYDYSYKPDPVFHGPGPLFLGLEIEIETPHNRYSECAGIACSYLKDLGYLKNDTSIGRGFEIVTHPMSYQWAIANFPWRMLTRLQKSECAATERTGIHVHVSRAGFTSPAHTYRWMKFIYRNEQNVTALARRCSPQWAAFTADDRRAVKDYAKGARGDRHRAINTANTDTFELRVFASSLDPREVQAALAFAAASIEYSRDLTIGQITLGGGWAWSTFLTWLSRQSVYGPLLQQVQALTCAS
jgi:hypothetical protein